MLGHAFAYSSAPIKTVREVQFGVLSPEEIVGLITVLPMTQPQLCLLYPAESAFCSQNRVSGGHG